MLARLIASLGIAAIRGEIAGAARRLRLRVILFAAAALLWLLALGFALGAFTVWLASVVGAILACVILAVVFAVIGTGLAVAARMVKQRSTPLVAAVSNALAPLRQVADEAKAAGAEVHPGEATSAATLLVLAVVGYILGRFMMPGGHADGDQPAPDQDGQPTS